MSKWSKIYLTHTWFDLCQSDIGGKRNTFIYLLAPAVVLLSTADTHPEPRDHLVHSPPEMEKANSGKLTCPNIRLQRHLDSPYSETASPKMCAQSFKSILDKRTFAILFEGIRENVTLLLEIKDCLSMMSLKKKSVT